MKRTKKFFALFFALVLVVNLMPHYAMAQNTQSTSAENENLISDGSFEGFVSGTLTQDQITSEASKCDTSTSPATREYNYNKATPTTGWQAYIDSGTGYFQPHLADTQDGRVAIKLSTGDVSGKMNLRYDVPSAVYSTLAEGDEYKLTLYVKGENADQIRIQIINGNNSSFTANLDPGQWTKIERTFKIDKSVSNKNYLRFFFGMGAETTNIALYIDNVSLVKVEPPAAELNGNSYKILADALAAAQSGDTVVLKSNVTTEDMVKVSEGVTLNLNGYKLTTDILLGFGQIIDKNAAGIDGQGAIVVDITDPNTLVYMKQNNAYLPIYDSVNGGYKLFGYELAARDTQTTDPGVKYRVAVRFANAEAYKVIAESESAGLSLSFNLAIVGTNTVYVLDYSAAGIRSWAETAYPYYSDPAFTQDVMLTMTVAGIDTLPEGTEVAMTTALSSVAGASSFVANGN